MTQTHRNRTLLIIILALAMILPACIFQKPFFINPGIQSTDQCKGININIRFQEETSSASSNEYTTNLSSSDGESTQEVRISGRLFCIWEQSYQSQDKAGSVRAGLQIYTLKDRTQAQAMFNTYSQGLTGRPEYCREDHECTVAIESFGTDRTYFVEKNVSGDDPGNPLPSYHSANLVRLITGPDEDYVLILHVEHPELAPGSDFVIDVVSKIENSLVPQK